MSDPPNQTPSEDASVELTASPGMHFTPTSSDSRSLALQIAAGNDLWMITPQQMRACLAFDGNQLGALPPGEIVSRTGPCGHQYASAYDASPTPRANVWLPGRPLPVGAFRDFEGAPAEDQVQMLAERGGPPPEGQSIAVLPLTGFISQRPSFWTALFGGTSTEMFGEAFDMVIASSQIAGIILEVDSGGGTVFGVHELTQKILRARGEKPIVAVANSMMASAAYEIASAADAVVTSLGSILGSIGVMRIHVSEARALENEGLKVEAIHAGQHKLAGQPFVDLSEAARAEGQRIVDSHYDKMTGLIAAGRGVSQDVVKSSTFGEGLCFTAEEAVEAGLADRVGTLDSAIADMMTTVGRRRTATASAADRAVKIQAIGNPLDTASGGG